MFVVTCYCIGGDRREKKRGKEQGKRDDKDDRQLCFPVVFCVACICKLLRLKRLFVLLKVILFRKIIL